MLFSIVTLFPDVFLPILNSSILKRAQQKGLVEFQLINLRDFGQGKQRKVDDRPYGGGAGMILKADVLAKALQSINDKPYTILMSASGKPFNQAQARKLSKLKHFVIVAGHYEGVDQRFINQYVDQEISIGDYILTGGEIPAMVLIDSITRLLKGVLENPEATKSESFEENLLEYPQFTRPEQFEGIKVPAVLLSGNHQQISTWRKKKSQEKTRRVRPDLLLKRV